MARKSTAMRKTAVMPKSEIELRGYIEKIIFSNVKNGFSIIIISLSGESKMPMNTEFESLLDEKEWNKITCKGIMPNVKTGDEVLLKGNWINDPKYGRQFNFSSFEILLPTSEQGVIAYFSGDNFYGLGRVAAEKIIAALGNGCLEKLKANPDLAFSIPGLSEKQKTELAGKMKEHGAMGDLIALICQHGIGSAMAGRIFAHYGPEALKIVKENPYQLTKDIDGIGFIKADMIGMAVGIKRNSPFRVDAAIRHVLEEARGEGHCALGSAYISDEVLNLLGSDSGVDYGDVARAGKGLITLGELYREKDESKNLDLVYLDTMYQAEAGLAEKIRAMVNLSTPEINQEAIGELIVEMAKKANITLAPEQEHAILEGLKNKISIVTGGPGTGKSTITRFIVAGHESLFPGREIYLAAPTGRAAKRLTEATGKEAKTIHRLLKYNPELGFEFDEYNQLPGPGLLIVDESSMIDLELAHNLFKAVPDNMQVIMVGDVDQLPSVGPGAVLRDVIASGMAPVTRLKYVYRQAEGSTIGLLADMINKYGENGNKAMPDLRELEEMCGGRDFQFIEAITPEDVCLRTQELIKEWTAAGIGVMDFMVLTPLRDRGLASAEKLNEMIRDIVNPEREEKKERRFGSKVFRDGDKVMKVKRNDYKKGLFNGDLGIMEIGERGSMVFNMDGGPPVELDAEDLTNIELAYSYTVHKSQGGEAPYVVVVCIRSHYIMLARPLIYTAITRGKKKVVVVGDQSAFEVAVKNNKVEQRYGLLKERIRGEI